LGDLRGAAAWGKAAPSVVALDEESLGRGWLYIVELDPAGLGAAREAEAQGLGEDEAERQRQARWKDMRQGKEALVARVGLRGEDVRHWYSTLPAVGVWLDKEGLGAVLADPVVTRVHAVQPMKLETASTLPFVGIPVTNGVNSDGNAGLQTTVAVIDSSVAYWRPEFGSCGAQGSPSFGANCSLSRRDHLVNCAILPQLVPGRECVPGTTTYEGIANATDHGTNVAGIVHNVAPGAKLWALNATYIARPTGNADPNAVEVFLLDSDILEGLDLINASPGDVATVNLSLGTSRAEGSNDECQSSLRAGIQELWSGRGILTVAAAGNGANKNAVDAPGCDPYVVSVGAQYDTQGQGLTADFGDCTETVQSGRVTCFSNSQTQVDLIAPGVLVAGGGSELTGTSQATPHVAGYGALLQSASVRGTPSRKLAAHELHTRLRQRTVNRAESAMGRDGGSYSYTHRQLSATGGIAPMASYELVANPAGVAVSPGATQTFSLATSTYNTREGDQTGRTLTDVWLDAQVSAPNAGQIELTLIAPSGASRVLAAQPGVNLNALYGSQFDAGLKDAFDGASAGGTWQLRVRHTGTTGTLRVQRAILMISTQAAPTTTPSTYGSFGYDKATVVANDVDVETFRLVLNNAAPVTDVRFLVNRAGQSENGLTNSGYFQWTSAAGCKEVTTGYGNDKVALQTASCQRNVRQDGSVEFVLPFTVSASFGATDNNQVSVIWYEGGVARSSWRKVTTTGAGFDTSLSAVVPSTYRSFSFDAPSVRANNSDVETFRLILNDAAPVTDVRLLVNRAGHAENGRTNSGYFQWTPATGCKELTAGYGNDKVALQTASCQRNVRQDGSIEFVFPFTVLSSFGVADSNTVSLVWYENGVARSAWLKVTATGQGFDVTQ
jgi:subtilisin-like proprotein convertase family protein